MARAGSLAVDDEDDGVGLVAGVGSTAGVGSAGTVRRLLLAVEVFLIVSASISVGGAAEKGKPSILSKICADGAPSKASSSLRLEPLAVPFADSNGN